MTSERLFFVAVAPEGATIDAAQFDAVCSPNPEDSAQLAIRQLSNTNRISLMSFGPRTVTSHEFLVGGVSVLGSLLRSFVDARREVKLVIEVAGVRTPSTDGQFYSINTENDVNSIARKLKKVDEQDVVRVTLVIQNYEIVLLSLPSFPPFGVKGETTKVNGWRAIEEPGTFVSSKTFVLLHFDKELATETAVMKILAGQDIYVAIDDHVMSMELAVEIDEESEYEYEYEEEDTASKSGSIINFSENIGKQTAEIASRHTLAQDAASIRSRNDKDEIGSARSQSNASRHTLAQDAASMRSRNDKDEIGSARSQSNASRHTLAQDAASLTSPNGKDISSARGQDNQSIRSQSGTASVRSQRLDHDSVPQSRNGSSSVSDRILGRYNDESARRDRPGDWQREEASESGDMDHPQSARSNRKAESQADKDSTKGQPSADDGQSQGRRRRRRKKKANPPKHEIQDVSFGAFTSGELAPDDNEVAPEFDPNDDSPEAEIKRFVAQLNMNIPVLEDASIFSTLVQQLFYEKWKSGALSRTKAVLIDLRDKLRKRFTDEIQSMKQLVSSNDLTIFIAREEQKMRLLENMAVETIQKALERRAGAYGNVTTRGLLRTFQTICGDHVTLQQKIRDRRAAIRSETMELRIAQANRLEKLQKYREHARKIEDAETIQYRIQEALERHDQLQQELADAEEDRIALLQQLEKVKAMLNSKTKNVR